MDRSKPGPRMHVLSDANGLPLRVGLSAANTHDSLALKPILSHFHMRHESHATDSKPGRLHADKAYDIPHLRRRLWGKHIGSLRQRKTTHGPTTARSLPGYAPCTVGRPVQQDRTSGRYCPPSGPPHADGGQ
ncbi:hypothetical protein GCM10010423_69100 [Streptomyces levis]|uniref:Transposase IS4-like domain-containing protein n=1 Tax=Streptomyces levis TaxID=285566 RepID=A0ABN3P1Z3_9ACTN